MNFEENKTVKSHFSYWLSSLLGFWVVLEAFGFFPIIFLLPLLERGKLETPTVIEHTRLEPIAFISQKSQSPEILLRQGFGRSDIEVTHTILEPEKHRHFVIRYCDFLFISSYLFLI